MNSALYECRVMHHRFVPKVHHFGHRIFMFALDLDEIDSIVARIPFFSRNRANLYAFRDRDHLTLPGMGQASTKDNVVAWLAREGFAFPEDGRVTLVTLPRVLGHIFNPVSFYFCEDGAGRPLCAIAEVGNTFGEQKPYLVHPVDETGVFKLTAPKHFYVSPFSPLDLTFEFTLRTPGDRLDVQINERAGDAPVLFSSVKGARSPLTALNLAWMSLKYPLITLKVIGLIHAHAVVLWFKRVPWYPKSANAALQRDLFRPHASISGKTR